MPSCHRCSVKGCIPFSRNFGNRLYFSLPSDRKDDGTLDPLKKKRQKAWLKAIQATDLSAKELEKITVCSKHFVSRRPALTHMVDNVDWVPSCNLPDQENEKVSQTRILANMVTDSLKNIIQNVPEVEQTFDEPDYIYLSQLGKKVEKQIEKELVQKYISYPICDENGYYKNDHDYLGLPLLPWKTATVENQSKIDHNYSIIEQPACLSLDLTHFCNICQKNCSNLFTFNQHLVSHTFQNHVRCFICAKKFLTTTCLNNHLTVHTELCDKCGNEVPSVQLVSHDLANRRQKHRGKIKVRPPQGVHLCVFCSKGFPQEADFKEHMLVHKKK